MSQINTTFASHSQSGNQQSYPGEYLSSYPPRTGADELDVLGWGTGTWGDAVYQFTNTFSHTSPELILSFSAYNLEPFDNETWGIDNILITCSNDPLRPQNLQINRVGNDIVLNWDPVTENAAGQPVTVSGYNIYASELPDLLPETGNLIDFSPTNSYNHLGVTPSASRRFYLVTAIIEEAAQ